MEEKQPIKNKFLGKGKTGKFCGFREKHYCNSNCGIYMESLGSCCLHGINWNLKQLNDKIQELIELEKERFK